MTDTFHGINPRMLKWARECAGYSLEDVATALKKEVADVEGWEAGNGVPTYVQLEKLAYKLYKRPIAIFFFPDPPKELDPKRSFRTLPEFEIERLSSDSLYAIRQAQAMQISLGELNDGSNPSENIIPRDIRIRRGSPIIPVAIKVREYLGISLEEQVGWRNSKLAFKNWRYSVENKGVFVFKRSFKQKDIFGFSLWHTEFPVVYVNNSTAHTRQIFSLFHEIPHLLLKTNGITKGSDEYVDQLAGDAKQIEVFCNRFAAEFLVPWSDFQRFLSRDFYDDYAVRDIADTYSVSREVILRRATDSGLVTKSHYRRKALEWTREYQTRTRPPGGDYYANQATYLGKTFLDLAFTHYYKGRCTAEQLADYLNVRVSSIQGLERFALS